MTVSIRRGVAADAEALAALAAITFPLATPDDARPDDIAAFVAEHLSADRFRGYLGDPSRDLLVAEPDGGGELWGYVMLIRGDPDDPEVLAAVTTRPTIDLNKFYVHPDHHGAGVAPTLMAAAIDAARAEGARSLWLGVNNENDRANAFYAKHGFAVVGTKHFQLGGRLEDDFVRERLL